MPKIEDMIHNSPIHPIQPMDPPITILNRALSFFDVGLPQYGQSSAPSLISLPQREHLIILCIRLLLYY